MKCKRRLVLAGLSLALVLALAVGGTLAYSTDTASVTPNTFTSGQYRTENRAAVEAELTEPGWDPGKALNLIPGQSAAKDPQITNTAHGGGERPEWIAAKVTFLYAGGPNKGKPLSNADMKKVTTILSIDYESDTPGAHWLRADGEAADVEQVYVYTGKLPVGHTTQPLFTTLAIKPETTAEQARAVAEMDDFVVYVEGFAMQDVAYNSTDDWLAAIAGNESPALWQQNYNI